MRLLLKLLPAVFLIVFPAIHLFSQKNHPIIWISSTDDNPWIRKSISSVNDKKTSASILIDPQKTAQTIDGFGGCFNELGWEALNSVPSAVKQDILQNLFNPESGCKFNICRMPIGANDYAVDWYSLNETAGDYNMNHFSIAHDRLRLIPYIKEAQTIRPDLKIWASPWSPPSWMKINKHYACSSGSVNDLPPERQGKEMEDMFILDEQTLSAYALYFSKFIREYKKEGIDIYAVHVQNEPNSCQNFPSCIWTPDALATFIGKYLGPEFEKDGLNTEIWLGTIERSQPERIDPILQDPDVAKYITGVGFQWAGKGAIRHVHENYPEMKLMQTETECGDGANDRAAMEHTFSLMKHYFRNGANSYMYWNMVLDHTGKSQWGWQQNSMITITEDLQVKYNPEFYLMKHFSHFIKPSAKFIDGVSDENCLAFLNPGNEIVIIYYNEKDVPVTKTYRTGAIEFHAELQKKSLNTFIVNAL
jgi:glucosylceramidase